MPSIFGFDQSNRLVHVREVLRGQACNCRCVVCDERLIARQGRVREHHFAHASGREPCDANHESLLHRYSKQAIAQASGLVAPPHGSPIVSDLGLEPLNETSSWLALAGIEVEKSVEDLRPDLMCVTDLGLQVAIEVAYSSFCDIGKIGRYEELGLPALEIDLRAFTPDAFDPDAVKDAVLGGVADKKWLWPARQEPSPTEPQNPAPLNEPRVAPVREIPARTRCPEEIIDIRGRWVSIKTLASGGIAVKVIRYDPETARMVKAIVRSHWAHYWPKGYSWIIERSRAEAARQQLRQLSKTTQLFAGAGVAPHFNAGLNR